MTENDSLEHAIHEAVQLSPYSPDWPRVFRTEQERLSRLFPQSMAIEHIGSTVIEGMEAKPIFDMLAGVASMDVARSLAKPLCQSGYTTSIQFNASLTDRQWFMRWADGHRTHYLHVVVHEGAVWQVRLKFRDALGAIPNGPRNICSSSSAWPQSTRMTSRLIPFLHHPCTLSASLAVRFVLASLRLRVHK